MNINVCRAGKVIFGSIVLIFLSSCSERARITGTVIDAYGKPLVGATLTIVDSAHTATSGDSGKFELPYTPGQFVVNASKSGYSERRISLNLANKAEYPAAPLTLYPVPPKKGVYLVNAREKSLTPLHTFRTKLVSGPKGTMLTLTSPDPLPQADAKGSIVYKPAYAVPDDLEITVINTTGIPLESLMEFELLEPEDLHKLDADFKVTSGRAIEVHKSKGAFTGSWEPFYKVPVSNTIEKYEAEKMIVQRIKLPKPANEYEQRLVLASRSSNFAIQDFVSDKSDSYSLPWRLSEAKKPK